MKASKQQLTSIKLSDKIAQTIRIKLGEQITRDVHYVYSYSDGTMKGVVRTNNGKMKVVYHPTHNNWELAK